MRSRPGPAGGRGGGAPWLARAHGAPAGAPLELPGPGWVVAGTGSDPTIAAWAEAAGWPLLADPLSGARRGAAAIAHYDVLADGLPDPACVLRTGDLPTSKRLRRRLAALDVMQISVDPERAWPDPDGAVTDVHDGPVFALRAATADPGWLDAWRAADTAPERAVTAMLP